MMIKEYYDEFKNQYSYAYLPKTLVLDFEAWCQYMDIPLDEMYYSIEEYTENLAVAKTTMRNYRTRLRRFIEYVYEKCDITIIQKGDLIW